MIKLKVTLTPVTEYCVGSSVPGERLTAFYRGLYIDNERYNKFIPPSTIKGLLRSAAVQVEGDNSCEFVLSKEFLRDREDKTAPANCGDIQNILEGNMEVGTELRSKVDQLAKKFKISCKVCRVFGNSRIKGKARIVFPNLSGSVNETSTQPNERSVSPVGPSVARRALPTRMAKDLWFSYQLAQGNEDKNSEGTSQGRKKRDYKELRVEVSDATIEFFVICEDEECKELVKKAVELIDQGLIRLGRYKSRGFGILRAKVEEIRS